MACTDDLSQGPGTHFGSLPSLDALKKLAVALRVSADYLLFDEDERTPADELKMQFQAVSRLDPADWRVIQEVVESILLKHDATRWTRPGSEEPAESAASRG